MTRFKTWVKPYLENKFVVNISKMLSGSMAGSALAFALAPIIARIYEPDVFGRFGFLTSIIGFMWVFGTGRLELALPMEENKERKQNIATIALIGSFCFLE